MIRQPYASTQRTDNVVVKHWCIMYHSSALLVRLRLNRYIKNTFDSLTYI